MGRSHEVSGSIPVLDRRGWLRWAALTSAATVLPVGCARRPEAVSDATPADAPLRFPGKVPMRALNDRAPLLETPWEYYRHDLTPNEAFFVRWHLELIPTTVDLRSWRLKVGGHVERPLELSLDELRRMEPGTVVAVNQCSGNSRSQFSPRVPGGQWYNGAMGNARWTGVRLRDLLLRAGLKAKALQVSFQGLDEGPLPTTPDIIKALDVSHALTPDVLVAYEMNGAALPMINGFPVRLIVPGWYGTYWIKSLTTITVLPHPFTGFWMAKAYHIPNTPNGNETPEALAVNTVPINRMNIRSFIVRPEAGEHLPARRPAELNGIAFDGGNGIRRVEVSPDGGSTWADARLGPDLGRYSFRRWRLEWTPPGPGAYTLAVRATSNSAETQPMTPGWNRSGFMRNVIERLDVTVG
jgi:DMSO/TMAO reductase YedYZ molybdopterin-dependent catalytic subunit